MSRPAQTGPRPAQTDIVPTDIVPTGTVPTGIIQTDIVHMIRGSLFLWGIRTQSCTLILGDQNAKLYADLKAIYSAPTDESTLLELDSFDEKGGDKFPSISES